MATNWNEDYIASVVREDNSSLLKLVKSINGEPSWKGDFSFLGPIARAYGLVWCGDWGQPNLPHSFGYNDHVQRCSVEMQAQLFRGDWYPGTNYSAFDLMAGVVNA